MTPMNQGTAIHRQLEDAGLGNIVGLADALSARCGGSLEALGDLWHPQISNEYKARLMDGLMSPTSPKAYRKETSFVYASGWPPAFIGDLYYYVKDYDLSDQAHEIDTNQVGVHILSGEYDYSGKSELGKAASDAIKCDQPSACCFSGTRFIESDMPGSPDA